VVKYRKQHLEDEMGLFDKLFSKKKNAIGEDDGQEQYFKEDFKPIKKVEVKPEKDAAAKTEKKAETKKSETVKKATAKADVKKDEPTKKIAQKSEAKKDETVKKTVPKKIEKEITEDSPEVKSAVAVKEGKPTKNGKFDIQKAKDGRFFFSLYSSNGAVVAYSQIYSSLSAVNTGIASVISNASKADIEDTTLKKPASIPCPKWEIYIDKAEQYRFRLYATNGLCVCHSSHGYATKSGCKGGIESIKRYAAEATVDKSYLK
jgi:uncharacterized protein YegP (UPF0339 family)